MKFLIAGLGSIGRRHLGNLLALGEEDIILLRTHRGSLPDKATFTIGGVIYERSLASFPVETDLPAALAHKPDAVIVSNPTALHLGVAIPAANAGCHLLIEKPISHSLEGTRELQNAVQRTGSQVLIGFQFRFHPGLQKIAQLLKEGAIGRPLSVRVHWGEYLPGWHPWEDYRRGYSARADLGGGVILTLSHPLDYLRWLLGDVKSLWAFATHSSDLQLDVEDTAEIGLLFKNGVIGSVHLDYNQRPAEHSLEIVGSQGTLRWDNASGAARLFRACSETPASDLNSVPIWKDFPPMVGFERNDLFLAEMRCFLEQCSFPPVSLSLRLRVPVSSSPHATLEDGIVALNLALSALHSARTGKRVDILV